MSEPSFSFQKPLVPPQLSSGARKKPLRPEVEAAFATYLQQVRGEQWEPHFLQVVQQVPHLPPEQQESACAAVPMKDRLATRAARAMNLRMNESPP